ncbi:MAG: DUF11 domain-containing protein [Gammaproteobacteria bacterium]|jgi:uncharacterized repeat protein (TIGR01451 family)
MNKAQGLAWTILLAVASPASAVADADLRLEKSVNDSTLMPAAAVEFYVNVSNLGPDPADEVLVTDQLPTGLTIPTGTVPVTSQGTYDSVSGTWAVGALTAGAEALMTLPAQVTADPLPVCIPNHAWVEAAQVDPNLGNNRAVVALRQPGEAARCVDLNVELTRILPILACGDSFVEIEVTVTNLGADNATNVVLRLEDGPDVPRGLEFVDDFCGGTTTCNLANVPSGSSEVRNLRAIEIRNSQPVSYSVTVSASSDDPDVLPGDETASIAFIKEPYEECDFGNSFGNGSGCFIATAAYGSAMHPHITALQNWRDRVLLTNATGRALVDVYYRYSPPMADAIADRPALRTAVRVFLWPVVMAVIHPMAAAAFAGFFLLLTATFCFRSRVLKRRRAGIPRLGP